MKRFADKIDKIAEEKKSNIVLALDIVGLPREKLLEKSLKLIEETSESICAVKINRQLLLPLGLSSGVDQIVKHAHRFNIQTIMDCKLSDVGFTNRFMAEKFFETGFDALTASPYVGWEGGLKPVFELAEDKGRGILVLVYMSHPGADQTFGGALIKSREGKLAQAYRVFAEWALEWRADGAVVGATKPEKILEVYGILKNRVPIYSPGVGFQGGDAKVSVRAGAKFLIVGRSIFKAEKPGEAAEFIRVAALEALKG
jgi:orotidine-5'-phosphate decarboxylase